MSKIELSNGSWFKCNHFKNNQCNDNYICQNKCCFYCDNVSNCKELCYEFLWFEYWDKFIDALNLLENVIGELQKNNRLSKQTINNIYSLLNDKNINYKIIEDEREKMKIANYIFGCIRNVSKNKPLNITIEFNEED